VSAPAPFPAGGGRLEIDLPGARAAFTTRAGGVSNGPYASLNLGVSTADDPESVRRNRRALAATLGVRLAFVRQAHGATVVRLSDSPSAKPAEADGQATTLQGVAPVVLVADCLPIAIAGGGAVATLHAGWRGLAAGVIAEGVRALREVGARGPLAAAIGPGAGPCCYEVGDEVRAAFASHGAAVRRGQAVDLKAIARAELAAAGVGAVHDLELCTICAGEERFFSHRRDGGVTGRQAGIAWLT
jgi:YfiH family protein